MSHLVVTQLAPSLPLQVPEENIVAKCCSVEFDSVATFNLTLNRTKEALMHTTHCHEDGYITRYFIFWGCHFTSMVILCYITHPLKCDAPDIKLFFDSQQ